MGTFSENLMATLLGDELQIKELTKENLLMNQTLSIKLYKALILLALQEEFLDDYMVDRYGRVVEATVNYLLTQIGNKGEWEFIKKKFQYFLNKTLDGDKYLFPEDVIEGFTYDHWETLISPWLREYRYGIGKDGRSAYREPRLN